MPSPRSALRFLAFWFVVSLIPFGLAIYLTAKIVYVNPREFAIDAYKVARPDDLNGVPIQVIGIYAPPPDLMRPGNVMVSYTYDEGSEKATVAFASAISGKIILNHVAGPTACVRPGPDSDPSPIPVEIFPIYQMNRPDDHTYLIANRGARAFYGFTQISCTLDSIVERQTYTERRIQFLNLGSYGSYASPDGSELGEQGEPYRDIGFPLKWTLTLAQSSSIENVTFIGGTNPGDAYRDEPERLKAEGGVREFGATRDFAFNDLVEVHWESLTMRSWRDVLIVIIGTLVALGAAMIVEAVRPLVDLWLGGEKLPPHAAPAIAFTPPTHSDPAIEPTLEAAPKTVLDSSDAPKPPAPPEIASQAPPSTPKT